MERPIQELFREAQEIFDLVKQAIKTGGNNDNPLLEILTQPAVEVLGALSFCAERVAPDLREMFQKTAQGLIDFLEQQEHANPLKEAQSVRLISGSFPTLRIPISFAQSRNT